MGITLAQVLGIGTSLYRIFSVPMLYSHVSHNIVNRMADTKWTNKETTAPCAPGSLSEKCPF